MNGVSFLVFYAEDVDETVRFYTALGLEFKGEQHGAGPRHYCCQLDNLALEIYPADEGDTHCGAEMLGILVDDLDEISLSLKAPEPYIISTSAPFGNGNRCVIRDPDGRKVFVFDEQDKYL